ncbi:MAG: 16S rRNA (cytosine(1402)-N(4))-methyltransferase, partial [Parcubacteria group bacterium]|nr:16S rRNA (cytosine(1402)-N(4))-methyltransferase [Parcubacteria group bacterium]
AWPEEELIRIFKDYGEEKNARKIAKAIVEARKQAKIETTGELVEIIGGRDIKTLARIFQALRIAVNNELENIQLGLEGAWRMLKPGGLASPSPSQGGPASPSQGGRLAAISFHSLEDRIVKNFFKERKISGDAEILTPKPVTPSKEEVGSNSRSRSAKLRAIRKMTND